MSAAHSFFCIASLLLTESQKTYILLFIETKRAQAAALQTLHLTGGTYGYKENPLQNLLERRRDAAAVVQYARRHEEQACSAFKSGNAKALHCGRA